jgi:cobalamin transport system substrate-binding protein
VPTATETLFALGAGDLVVGRCSYCDYPPAALAIPAVADALSAGPEAVIGLKPDLILVGSDAQARSLGAVADLVPVEKVIAEDLAGVRRTISRLGELTGREVEATILLSRISKALEQGAKIRTGRPKRVLFVVQREPLRVAGGASHITELLAYCDAENVAADLRRPWPEFSAESLVERDPEIIIDASLAPGEDEGTILAWWRRFDTLAAVREGRVFQLTETAVVRPGPRVPEALGYLRELLSRGGR